jgi:hypothetical protein
MPALLDQVQQVPVTQDDNLIFGASYKLIGQKDGDTSV